MRALKVQGRYGLLMTALSACFLQGCATGPTDSGSSPASESVGSRLSRSQTLTGMQGTMQTSRSQSLMGEQPSNAAAQRNYEQAKVLLSQGEWALAMRSIDQCLALEPTHIEALNARASILARWGNLAEAGRVMQFALTLDDSRAHLHYNQGLIRRMQGDQNGSRAAFQRAIDLDPSHANARDALSTLTLASPPVGQKATAVASATGHMSLVRVPTFGPSGAEIGPMAGLTGLPSAVGAQMIVPESVVIAARREADIRVVVMNARGASGIARHLSAQWREEGLQVSRSFNRDNLDLRQTRIYYRPGFESEAKRLARNLPLQAAVMPARAGAKRDLLVIVGKDLRGQQSAASDSEIDWRLSEAAIADRPGSGIQKGS